MTVYETDEIIERVILVGVAFDTDDDTERSLDELGELAKTAGAQTVGRMIQTRDNFHPATYIGKGKIEELRLMMKIGVEHEINWGNYVIGENIQGINKNLIDSYIKYLGNKRLKEIGLEPLFEGYDKNPAPWVDSLSNANTVKTDFFEAKSTAYAKASVLVDDL